MSENWPLKPSSIPSLKTLGAAVVVGGAVVVGVVVGGVVVGVGDGQATVNVKATTRTRQTIPSSSENFSGIYRLYGVY